MELNPPIGSLPKADLSKNLPPSILLRQRMTPSILLFFHLQIAARTGSTEFMFTTQVRKVLRDMPAMALRLS